MINNIYSITTRAYKIKLIDIIAVSIASNIFTDQLNRANVFQANGSFFSNVNA